MLIILFTLFLNIDSNIKETIIYANILLIIFNLIPMYPLDGGRIIKSLLKLKYDKMITEKVVNDISNIIVIMITIVASILIMYVQNIAILFIVVYLWIIRIRENRWYNIKKNAYDTMRKEELNSKIKCPD